MFAGRNCTLIHCVCGLPASRQAVNHIGVSGLAQTPMGERDYQQSFREYTEAVAEVADATGRARYNGDPAREPDYFRTAAQKARARGFRIDA